jgi:DNA-binding NtrC family response regulator
MEEHSILIADKNTNFLKEISGFFKGAGYAVSTTDSSVSVICDILKKNIPVLLLGGDFDKKIGLPQLLHLLKKCNRHLAVIMVSDEESLPMMRTIRQEGIFYHALRPETEDDLEEIKQAVDCAIKAK